MWPFTKPQPARRRPTEPEEELDTSATAQLQQLRADFAQLRMEWADTLDRITRWSGRMAARERQRVHRDLETNEDAPGEPNGHQAIPEPRERAKAALRSRVAQLRGRAG